MQMQPITFCQNLAQRVAVTPLSGTGAANAVPTAKPTAHNTPKKPSSPVFAPQSPCLQIRPPDCAPEGAPTNITRNPIGPHPAGAPIFASISPATFEAWKPLPQFSLSPSPPAPSPRRRVPASLPPASYCSLVRPHLLTYISPS